MSPDALRQAVAYPRVLRLPLLPRHAAVRLATHERRRRADELRTDPHPEASRCRPNAGRRAA
jgi:hypothetical protein